MILWLCCRLKIYGLYTAWLPCPHPHSVSKLSSHCVEESVMQQKLLLKQLVCGVFFSLLGCGQPPVQPPPPQTGEWQQESRRIVEQANQDALLKAEQQAQKLPHGAPLGVGNAGSLLNQDQKK